MLRTFNRFAVLALAAGFFTVGCSDDDVVTPEQPLPTTYEFDNVDYSGQLARIQLLDKLEKEAKKGTTSHVTYAALHDIFINSAGDFNTTKQLKDKTHSNAIDAVNGYFGEIDRLSQNLLLNVKEGNDGAKYLVDENGVEPAQMIAKHLMGAHQYWQATSEYLGEAKMSADNKDVIEGQGTKMQHHWDEAFGYFGAPKDFPANEGKAADAAADQKAWFWAKYANSRSAQVDVRQDIMNAFIKGRAAIGKNDMVTRDQAIATIRENWDKLAAANVVHYINGAITELKKGVTMKEGAYYHSWSEAKAFALALQYNPASKIVAANKYTELQTLLGANPGGATVNKEQKIADLTAAKQLLQQAYGFTDTQMQNL